MSPHTIVRPLALLLLSSVVAVPARAQAPGAALPEAAVDSVRARYQEVQRILREGRRDSTVTPFESPGGEGSVTTHRADGRVRSLVVRFDGHGASWRTELVYWDDALLFGFRRWERFPPEGPTRASEDRWYVWEGRVLRWLRTEESGVRRTVTPTGPDFASSASAFLTSAACWWRFALGPGGAATC
ncbi:MAG: hypothetical protein AAB409_02365 [Gemmatimonadota bacterium]